MLPLCEEAGNPPLTEDEAARLRPQVSQFTSSELQQLTVLRVNDGSPPLLLWCPGVIKGGGQDELAV